MNSTTALYWMIAFTATATACLIVQVILLAVMARASLAAKNQTAKLTAKVVPLAESSKVILDEVRGYAAEISGKTNDLLDLTKRQLVRLDDVMGEATARTRAQMDRIEMVMDDTVNRFQETTSLLQSGLIRPLKQINALTAGVRAALAALTGGRRTTVEQATHDEEMFI
jgi:hypothetical protein